MASVTLTDNQWKALHNLPRGAAAGGSVVIDVTAGDLTVTKYPLAAGAGTAQLAEKRGTSGQQK